MRRKLRRRFVWFLAAAGLAGCGGGSSSAPATALAGDEEPEQQSVGRVHKTGSGSVVATMGEAGGTLELSGGPRVEVPPGAIEEPQEFVLREAPITTAFANSEHDKPVGQTFLFSPGVIAPEGSTIEVSIPMAAYPDGWGEATLAYEEPEGRRVGAEDTTKTIWNYEPGELRGGRAVAELVALPGMRLQFIINNLRAQ